MRKRLAILTATGLVALGGLSAGASAALFTAPPHNGAPAGGANCSGPPDSACRSGS
jgi:hypothetical protein